MGGIWELQDGKIWEWDLSFRWEWEWDGNGNKVIEMGGICYEKIYSRTSLLQRAIDRFKNWSDTWLLELNVSKCKMVSYSMKDRTDTTYSISDDGETYALEKKIK